VSVRDEFFLRLRPFVFAHRIHFRADYQADGALISGLRRTKVGSIVLRRLC
jgi:hypothetical protein